MEMDSPITLFNKAEQFLRKTVFSCEIDWWENHPGLLKMADNEILEEYAFVVFSSGMSNAVIEAKWEDISKAFRSFNLKLILDEPDAVLRDGLNIFNHEGKVKAIIQFCKKLRKESFAFKRQVNENPLETLTELKFIGPKTMRHLARNLGFPFIKPDEHLIRLAARYGMTPFELGNFIHKERGRKLGVIDAILWRYSEQQGTRKATKSRHSCREKP